MLCVLIRIAYRGDSDEYTQYTIFNIKKVTLNYPKSAAMDFFSKGLKNEFKWAINVQATEVLLYVFWGGNVSVLLLQIALYGSPDGVTLTETSNYITGPCCSKLTTSLVTDLLKFQTLISQICQYFLLKKCEKLLQCKSFSHFFNKKFQCIWL